MAMTDDDLPVLSDVIQSGDETIIRSTRLQRVSIETVDDASSPPFRFELPSHLQFDQLPDEGSYEELVSEQPLPVHRTLEQADTRMSQAVSNDLEHPDAVIKFQSVDDELELLIDEIIDKHIVALRSDLRTLLERARELP